MGVFPLAGVPVVLLPCFNPWKNQNNRTCSKRTRQRSSRVILLMTPCKYPRESWPYNTWHTEQMLRLNLYYALWLFILGFTLCGWNAVKELCSYSYWVHRAGDELACLSLFGDIFKNLVVSIKGTACPLISRRFVDVSVLGKSRCNVQEASLIHCASENPMMTLTEFITRRCETPPMAPVSPVALHTSQRDENICEKCSVGLVLH